MLNPIELRLDLWSESGNLVSRESYILLVEHCVQYANV